MAHLIGLRLPSFLLKRKKLCDAEPGKDPMAALAANLPGPSEFSRITRSEKAML